MRNLLTASASPDDAPLPYRTRWERELRAGIDGQDRQCSSTWKLDGLWRAACLQAEAEELELVLKHALGDDAPLHTIAALVNDTESLRQRAHLAFLADEREGGRHAVA